LARYGSDGQRYPPAMTPDYWQQASADLAQDDLVLAGLVERFAGSALVSRGDPFVTLLRSIVGQQISVKAADSVWTRLTAGDPPTPAGVLSHDPQTLRGCGLSVRKVEYLLTSPGISRTGRSTSITGRR
jgi:DNA-3-methyladenine glycosylase II